MKRGLAVVAVSLAGIWGAVTPLSATELTLNAIQFPEKKEVDVGFVRSAAAPRGVLSAEVEFKEGQGEIDVKFGGMKPAVLFGGDVTSYVLWAVTREGKAANLGELWVREAKDDAEYTTGLKEFALLVTAESHPLVDRPSQLVIFYSLPTTERTARNTEFAFSSFAPAPAREHDSIAEIPYTREGALDLRQAQVAYDLATRADAEAYAPKLMSEAGITLAQATNLATRSNLGKELRDYARRTVALASEAIRTTERKKEAERLEREIAQRRAEMEALATRAADAEKQAATAEQQATEAARQAQEAQSQAAELQRQRADLEARMSEARLTMQRLASESTALAEQTTRLQSEKTQLESSMDSLRAERAALIAEREELAAEKQRLSERLKGALDQVANTQESARGMIVNLPDILFDTNEATLKPGAKVTLAKLAGILLIMPELNLRIEGHTDSTGSADYNQRLSERRAASVDEFLADQGIASGRMTSAGYGQDRPIADNATKQGRAKNRRVEIVIAEGTVDEAPAN